MPGTKKNIRDPVSLGRMTGLNDPGPGENPDDHLRDVLQSNYIMPISDDSSEEDEEEEGQVDDGHGEYTPLPQIDPTSASFSRFAESDDSDEIEEDSEEVARQILSAGSSIGPSPDTINLFEEAQRAREREEAEERIKIWNGDDVTKPISSSSANDEEKIRLDGSKLESIKTAMANISLPETSFPPWAKEMSEAEWADLVKRRLTTNPSKVSLKK